ncbi:MAG: YfhO family protein [Oscillospiraceae bacterium]|nr:YfhO family protein [Oscillospiraceae bacterium]
MNHRLIRRAGVPLLTGALTFFLYLIFFGRYQIYPCGNNTIVWCDMEQQAVPLLVQLRKILLNGGSVRYTVLDAGGMQYYGIFFFFLSNPLSFLVLLTNTAADRLVGLLVILKLSAAAGTASLWLKYRVPNLNAGMQILLGAMYGCCGYGLLYYQNLMWLDVMAMIPLILISMQVLLKKENALPYFFCLCATMLLCFYLCYMVVLFVLIYMILSVRFTVPKERRGRVSFRFWVASILAASVTAFVWIPCFLQVMHSARSESLLESLRKGELLLHFYDKFCLISCTGLGIAVLPALFMRRHLKTGTGKRDLGLFILLFAAILLNPVNKMWHTGSYQAFPMRWGMIPVLLMLTLAARLLSEKKGGSPLPEKRFRIPVGIAGTVLPVALMLTVCILMHMKIRNQLTSYSHTLWFSIPNGRIILLLAFLFAFCYGTVIFLHKKGFLHKYLCALACTILFVTEFAVYFDVYPGENANEDKLFFQTAAAEEAFPEQDGLSRVKMTKKYTHANMIGALGVPTMAHYTSLTREDYLSGVKRFGYSSYWMEVSSAGGTLLSDLLWNVRYQLGQSNDFPSWTEKIWSDRQFGFSAAESKLALPAALYSDAAPEALAELPAGSRAEVQRHLAETMLGQKDAVVLYQPDQLENVTLTENADGTVTCSRTTEQDGKITWSIPVQAHQALYFDLFSQTGTELWTPRYQSVTVSCNGRVIDTKYPEKQHNGLLFLTEAEGSTVTVKAEVHHNFTCESFGVFGLDLDAVKTGVLTVKGTDLSYRDGTYTAQCQTDAPKTLIMSVAYDEGFTAKVNGKTVPVFRVNSCQTAVQIPAGSSKVELIFHVQGLRAGLAVCAGGLLLALLWLFMRKRLLASRTLCRAAAVLMQAAFCGILLLVYCLPVLLCEFFPYR